MSEQHIGQAAARGRQPLLRLAGSDVYDILAAPAVGGRSTRAQPPTRSVSRRERAGLRWLACQRAGARRPVHRRAVRNRVVTTIGSADMTGLVTNGRLGMTMWVAGANGHDVLVDMVLVRVMQMAVVK
jgi:hypothetical protein